MFFYSNKNALITTKANHQCCLNLLNRSIFYLKMLMNSRAKQYWFVLWLDIMKELGQYLNVLQRTVLSSNVQRRKWVCLRPHITNIKMSSPFLFLFFPDLFSSETDPTWLHISLLKSEVSAKMLNGGGVHGWNSLVMLYLLPLTNFQATGSSALP